MDREQLMNIPFHRPDVGDAEIEAVSQVIRSGWLTTGPAAKRFESEFAEFCGLPHAVAVNSATAALHLALDAIGLKRGEAVLVPTMTFAASAEVVRYFDAVPLLFDCRADDLNPDYASAERVLASARAKGIEVRALMVVHYGGLIGDVQTALSFAKAHGLKVIEDAAHCGPSLYRHDPQSPWLAPGAESEIACYSFYANKCITTGEGGMAVTRSEELANRMRMMSLHGISRDAWKRFTAQGSWAYDILLPGFKYNMTDVAAAMGLVQLAKAGAMRDARERVAMRYLSRMRDLPGVVLPVEGANRLHSWHLFVIRFDSNVVRLNRAEIIAALRELGVLCSVHWVPLHMHPYYRENYGYSPIDLPVAANEGSRVISLPIYPSLADGEVDFVCDSIRRILEGSDRPMK